MPQGTGKHTHVDFASGTRSLDLPDIDDATANPVILFFLERDVRDMERRTGGKAAYFRKRVRLAFSESAEVQPVQFEFAGRKVSELAAMFRKVWSLGNAGVDVPLLVYRDGRTFEMTIPSGDRNRFLKGPSVH